jgi:hypothetical protein
VPKGKVSKILGFGAALVLGIALVIVGGASILNAGVQADENGTAGVLSWLDVAVVVIGLALAASGLIGSILNSRRVK